MPAPGAEDAWAKVRQVNSDAELRTFKTHRQGLALKPEPAVEFGWRGSLRRVEARLRNGLPAKIGTS